MSSRLPVAFLCFVAAVLAFFTDSRLTASGAMRPADPLTRLIGDAKEAVGDTLFLKADAYFHGGVIEKNHHDESVEDLAREGALERDKEAGPSDWVARINASVRAHQDIHLPKNERKEMLPFFALSTALAPHNVEAALTAAYWLETEFDRAPEAVELLRKAARDNPQSWEIEHELGRAYLKRKDDPAAEMHFEAALRKAGDAAKDFERIEMLYHLGEARLAQGKKKEALDSSHELSEAELLCDSILIIHAGRALRSGPLDEVLAGQGVHSLERFYVNTLRGAP